MNLKIFETSEVFNIHKFFISAMKDICIRNYEMINFVYYDLSGKEDQIN